MWRRSSAVRQSQVAKIADGLSSSQLATYSWSRRAAASLAAPIEGRPARAMLCECRYEYLQQVPTVATFDPRIVLLRELFGMKKNARIGGARRERSVVPTADHPAAYNNLVNGPLAPCASSLPRW